jgi:hypothetical protein
VQPSRGGRCTEHSIVNVSERSITQKGKLEITYLVLAKEREMHEDFDRFSVSGEDDKFRDTAVERFRG